MLRFALTAAAIVFLAAAPPAALQAPQQPPESPVFRGSVQSIEVDVRAEHGHVIVDVRDHGIGIARREQRRIFRKFYRVGRELGGGPQGTGLGLAIVDHTMRGHGGYVRVDSEPGHGSTFSLHFTAAPPAISEGVVDEAHSGDRGRAADAARPA